MNVSRPSRRRSSGPSRPPSRHSSQSGSIETVSDGRRAIVSVFLVVVLFSLAAANLPNSSIRATMLSAATPVLNATGLDQTWSVFAPGPRRQVLEVSARIKYSDGQTGTWHMPTGGPWIGAYRDYRWRKWMEFG